ncbi:DNA polymerase III subunit alpha [Sodalis-like secondary symbiont of Drepanosiphum platanoidis]|uniref:DNA polymerase III subunit alpha n=1 Tax=Sodalis-like secondary symbiont of Drepanosiphum platanoidis TaxID=2994493 RepID=UPI003464C0FC
MFSPKFIHLRVHSDYSMIDGLIKINKLIKKILKYKMPSIALTDFNNLFGLINFYKSSCSNGIKPIIGSDVLIKTKMLENELCELTILASNNIGYNNLILLISKSYKQGYKKNRPFINEIDLAKYNEGLILLSGGKNGNIGKNLINKNFYKLEKSLEFYQKYFYNRFYIELIRTGRENEEKYICYAIELASKKNLPVVATNDVRFIKYEDFYAHEIRVSINNRFTLENSKRPKYYSPQQYLRTEKEMCDLFSDIPEALINSVEISRRCNVTINFRKKYFLPKFPTGNISSSKFLIKKSYKGLKKRLYKIFPNHNEFLKKKEIYFNRLDSELKIINKMKFPGYFLIVMEFIQWAKKNNIPVGPGRGSGAGSLVAYSLNITDINPLNFDLLFERFLNPERISMPDFDIDFCMEKRDLVINHVSKIYGSKHVSQIITFGTMTAKAVIRDVGRVLGYSYGFVDRIAKLIPFDPGMTLKKALNMENQLKISYKHDKEVKRLIDISKKLEGTIRNVGKHAGGVVISPSKITNFSPLYFDSDGKNPMTQFDKNDIEYIGLVKFDFLGLKTLTIIDKSVKMINKNLKTKNLPKINISNISYKDKKSFKTLKKSETIAVFQLESHGMRDLIKRLIPDSFEDIIALVALFRPGPLQSGMVENFINRKHGKEIISYPDKKWQHKSLKPILNSTYGIILYQEQVMKIAQILSGYTLEDADILRRVMGKKQSLEMKKQKYLFENGAKKNGINDKLATKIFNLVEKFSGYGFNKSHSTAYALISYQTLWLKSNFPAEFMASVMTADIDNIEKIISLINECKKMKLKICPPNINLGQYFFYVHKNNEIIYGMGAIKGLGKETINILIKERNINGPFLNLLNLCIRTNFKKINKKILEKLIMSGSLDSFNSNRVFLMNSLKNILQSSNQYLKNKISGQKDMFGIFEKNINNNFIKNNNKWTYQKLLKKEKDTLGFYLTQHPIDQFKEERQYYSKGIYFNNINLNYNNKVITIIGLVISFRIFTTKNKNIIGICTLDDSSLYLETILFSDILNKYKKLIKKDNILLIKGKINFNTSQNNFKLIVYKLINIEKANIKYIRKLIISIDDSKINKDIFLKIKYLLKSHEYGNTSVFINFKNKKSYYKLYSYNNFKIKPTNYLLNNLRSIIGNEKVKLKFY